MTSRDRPSSLPCALVIAGLDPSGGAGICADERAIVATGAWACIVCAVITVQSTTGLESIHPVDPELVRAQAVRVLRDQRVRSLKTGALGSVANVRAVCAILREHPRLPAVVDPVMVATRAPTGARLLDAGALEAMRDLVSLATVVTPNVDEAEALLETRICTEADLERAARNLCTIGAKAALVKGGHLKLDRAVDVLAIGKATYRLAAPRLAVPEFHGGGCTLASLVAGELALSKGALDERIVHAVRASKRRLHKAIRSAAIIGKGLRVLPL